MGKTKERQKKDKLYEEKKEFFRKCIGKKVKSNFNKKFPVHTLFLFRMMFLFVFFHHLLEFLLSICRKLFATSFTCSFFHIIHLVILYYSSKSHYKNVKIIHLKSIPVSSKAVEIKGEKLKKR